MGLSAAVLGGGISGLTSALHLVRLGHQVSLFETEESLGGLGASFAFGDLWLERFYHSILPTDRALLALLDRLGLADEVTWRPTAMGFVHRGRLHPLDTALDLLRFAPLPLLDRLRLGWLGLRIRALRPDEDALDGLPAPAWLESQIGARATRTLLRPLLAAKLGQNFDSVPALWLHHRLSREKNTRREVRGCLRGGYRALVQALERALLDAGVELRPGTAVRALERDGEGTRLVHDSGREPFDLVVATLPLPEVQRLAAPLGLPPGVAGLRLDYQGVVSAAFLTERPLSRFFWMPVVESGTFCQGIVEMSHLIPPERTGGLHLSYLVHYTHRSNPLFRAPEESLLDAFRRDLERLFPEAARTVADGFLFRAPFVEPLWPLGYLRRRPPVTLIPGRLYLAGTSQVYPRVNSWNSCCEVTEELAAALRAGTASSVPAPVRR